MKAQAHSYASVNKDFSVELFPNNLIYQLRNGRMTTDAEIGTEGGVINIRGNKYNFTIPAGKYILNYTTIVETVYLITTDSLTEEGGTGYIYKVVISPKTLVSVITLIYSSPDLLLSVYRTVQSHGIRENSTKERLYFSEHKSETRSLNLITIPVDAPIEFTQLHPDASFSAPIVEHIFEGGDLRRGVYEYAFYLTTYDGKKSLLSENSVPISLIGSAFNDAKDYSDSKIVDESPNSTNFGNTFSASKSVKISVDVSQYPSNLYDTVTFVAIYSGDKFLPPEITAIDTVSLVNNKATFIHSGLESEVFLSYNDYVDNRYPFFTNKTFAAKDQVLLAGNTRSATLTLDYNASTNRYLKTGETYEDFHFNPYNDESGTHFTTQPDGTIEDWQNNDQYKYQNPTENNGNYYLGGTGDNIDYTFVLHELDSGLVANKISHSDTQIINEIVSLEQDYPSGYLNNFNSPYLRFLKGYKRGEIYRFGISFTSKKGNKSFVKYIGDIKMPELSERAGYVTIPGTTIDYFPLARTTAFVYNEQIPLNGGLALQDIAPGYTYQQTFFGVVYGVYNLDFNYFPYDVEGIDDGPSPPAQLHVEISINGFPIVSTEIFTSVGTSQGTETILNGILLQPGDEVVITISNDVDSNSTVSLSGSSVFNLTGTGKKSHFYSLGLEFNVKNIPDGYDSYQICAVQREDRFKTRLAQGYGTKSFALQNEDYSIPTRYAAVGNPISPVSFYATTDSPPGLASFTRDTQNDFSRRDLIPLCFPEVSYGTMDLSTFGNCYLRPIGLYSEIVVRDGFNPASTTDYFVRNRGNNSDNADDTLPRKIRGKFHSTVPFNSIEFSKAKAFEKIKASVKNPGTSYAVFTVGGYEFINYLWNHDQVDGSLVNGSGPYDINYVSRSGTKQFVQLERGNHELLFGGKNYAGGSSLSMVIFDYTRLLPEHYGGNGIDAISKNVFKAVTRPIFKTGYTKVFGGDTYISFYDSLYGMWDIGEGNDTSSGKKSYLINTVIPVESDINIDISHGKTMSHGASREATSYKVQETGNDVVSNYFDYEDAYSIFSLGRPQFSQPIRFLPEEDAPTRIYISDTKIYGEQTDSWSKFRINSYKDLETSFGSLTKLVSLKDNILFLQEEGMGLLSINPRAVITASDGIATTLGTSEGLERYQYVSTKSGTKHHLSVVVSDNTLYYYDVVNNRWMSFTGGDKGGLSSLGEEAGFQSLFLQYFEDNTNFQNFDRPYVEGGIVSHYDSTNKEVSLTFHGLLCPELIDVNVPQNITNTHFYVEAGGTMYQAIGDYSIDANSYGEKPYANLEDYQSLLITDPTIQQANSMTLAWSEKKMSFNDIYDYKPFIYVGDNKNMFSPDPSNPENCYIHNKGNYGEFYNVTYPFQISLILNGNDDKPLNKTLAYTEYNAIVKKGISQLQDKTFDTVRVYNDYQDSSEISLNALPDNSEHERRFRKWRFNMPSDITSGDYMRGPWSILTLTCDNTQNYSLALQTLINYYETHEY